MGFLLRVIFVATFIFVGTLLFTEPASASRGVPDKILCDTADPNTPGRGVDNGLTTPGVVTSIGILGSRCIEAGNTFETNPIVIFLTSLLTIFAGGVGLVVVGGVMWGGFLYMTARGNAAQTQKATMTIVGASIGLLLFIFMFALLNFIVPGGILG